jgi:hypothetical protein
MHTGESASRALIEVSKKSSFFEKLMHLRAHEKENGFRLVIQPGVKINARASQIQLCA